MTGGSLRVSTILALYKEAPEMTIKMSISDLFEFGDELVRNTQKSLEQIITDANTETYPSVDQVSKMLDVDKSSLWRWAKRGYLVPIEVGGKRRYKMSDVKRILNGGVES